MFFDLLISYNSKDSAGLIIGKGGSNIKDMMISHSVKVVIDREEYQNMRKVNRFFPLPLLFSL